MFGLRLGFGFLGFCLGFGFLVTFRVWFGFFGEHGDLKVAVMLRDCARDAYTRQRPWVASRQAARQRPVLRRAARGAAAAGGLSSHGRRRAGIEYCRLCERCDLACRALQYPGRAGGYGSCSAAGLQHASGVALMRVASGSQRHAERGLRACAQDLLICQGL